MLADLFGEWEPPDELVNASDGARGLMSNMAGMGAWVEWTVLAACVAVQVAIWGSVVGIKLVRAVVAHIPGFGGAGD